MKSVKSLFFGRKVCYTPTVSLDECTARSGYSHKVGELFMKRSIIAAVMAGTLFVTGLTGCKKEEAPETTAATTAETTAASETDAEQAELNYSKGIADNGFIEGVRCLDYVTLPDFSELSFKKADIECSEEELDEDIAALSNVFDPVQITDRAIKDQDQVCIDYTGYMDGEAFDRGAATDAMVTAGTNQFIDDFLYQIIGHMPGETFDVEVTFPDPYPNNPDFAGRDAVFTVTINYIAEYPVLTDEWITENLETVQEKLTTDEITDLASLRQYIYDYYYEDNLKQAIYEYVNNEGNIEVTEVPQAVIDVAKNIINCECIRQYGYTLDSVMETNAEEIGAMLEADARNLMIYQAYAEQQGWESITAADLEELTGTKDNAERIEAYGVGYLAQTLLYYRTYDHLSEIVTIEE